MMLSAREQQVRSMGSAPLSIVAHTLGIRPNTVTHYRRNIRAKTEQPPLTLRQREMLALLSIGMTLKDAATVMGINYGTAKRHKFELVARMGKDRFRKAVFRNA